MNRKKSFKGVFVGIVLGIFSLFSFSPDLGAQPIKIGMMKSTRPGAYWAGKSRSWSGIAPLKPI